MSLLPSPELALVVFLGSVLMGLSLSSIRRLVIIYSVVIALHFALIILLPYLSYLPGPFPGGLALAAIFAYVIACAGAAVGYGIRILVSRLFLRRET